MIFGTGSFPQTVRRYLERDTSHRVVAFTIDAAYVTDPSFEGLPVVPFERLSESYSPEQVAMFVALGYRRVNRLRADVFARCRTLGYELVTYVSPRAVCADQFVIGANCFVFEAVVLGGGTVVGDDVVIWSGAHLAHDTSVGDHCFIAPRAAVAGNVRIGAASFIGINATIRDGISIAPSTVVGAGAVIMADTVEGGVYSVRGTDPLDDVWSWDLDAL